MHVILTFTEPLLGTCSGNHELAKDYIIANRPDGAAEDEIESLPPADQAIEKSSTLFARDADGRCILWDYQIKGFFKDACSMLRRVSDTKSKKLAAHKKVIDGLVFVAPRQIRLNVSGELEWLERPLRAQTAKGERVALARSEAAPAGSWIEISINVLDKSLKKMVEEWLDYGQLRGLGQWRNASYGRFQWKSK